ncbi:hypothetical protein MRB53_040605 [Persea americana]|nr:hypothetical protein MRB53_040605 [Persea americana]
MSLLFTRIVQSQQYNLQVLRDSPIAELSGCLGDLGTLLPLLIALARGRSIVLSTTLVFTGLANILTGVFFSIPLPVQPMKAIAAVAIANHYDVETTVSAGIFVSCVILVASVTGILGWLGKVIPIPVVKGIQVGAGLSLVLSAGTSLLQPLEWTSPAGDNYLWTITAFALLLITAATSATTLARRDRIPYALLVFLLGLIIAFVSLHHSTHDQPLIGFWRPSLHIPRFSDLWRGTIEAGIGQLPLTTLNSIIAVNHLSADLLPEVPTPSTTSIGLSVAAMNLVGCWFGAMPVCHGSGGLAAQFRFGARSGASVIVLGMAKLIVGLVIYQGWLEVFFDHFPRSLLGIMVIAAGVELAKVGQSLNNDARDLWESHDERGAGKHKRTLDDKERTERWTVMMVTVAGLLAFKNDAIGFMAGLLWHWSLRLPSAWQNWRGTRIRLPDEVRSLTNEEHA